MQVVPIVLWGVALAAALIALPRLILWHKRPRQADRLLADWGCKTRAKQLGEDLLEDVAGYWREIRAEIPPEEIVDDITWRDLDMDEIFQRIDFTFSAAGSEALYALMRFTGEDDTVLARRSEILDALRSDRASRKALFSGLVRMPRERFCGAVSLLYSSERMGPECPWLYYALAALPLAIALGALLYPPLLLGLAISFLLNLVLHLLEICIGGGRKTPSHIFSGFWTRPARFLAGIALRFRRKLPGCGNSPMRSSRFAGGCAPWCRTIRTA